MEYHENTHQRGMSSPTSSHRSQESPTKLSPTPSSLPAADYEKPHSATTILSEDGELHKNRKKESAIDEKYKMPQFSTGAKSSLKRQDDDTIEEESLAFTKEDIVARKKGLKQELSLFTSTENAQTFSETKRLGDEEEIKMERPVTPIDAEIKRQPHIWEQMNKYVRRRIAADKKVEHLSLEDQQDLAEILVAEVYHIWPEIKRQIDDPFLSPSQNVELNRRIAVHIVTVCERLYSHYLKKAQILTKRGVFSGPANMSRLKAQLGIEASKYLNVLTIRRYIVADIRGFLPELESTVESDGERKFTKPALPRVPVPPMSFKGMLKQSRPKKEQKKRIWKTTDEDLQEMKDKMPDLDTTKLISILADMPRELLEGYSEAPSNYLAKADRDHKAVQGSRSHQKVRNLAESVKLKQRSRSMPELAAGETLLQELGLQPETKEDRLPPTYQRSSYQRSNVSDRISAEHHAATPQPQLYRHHSHEVLFVPDAEKPNKKQQLKFDYTLTRDAINLDLKRLMTVKKEPELPDGGDDLPPLLQAILRHSKYDGKELVHQQKIRELEEKERLERLQNSAPLKEPEFPQPATVAQKMANKTVVRTSDIRPSKRVCMESITVQKNSIVYNDLLDEIDSFTVKQLDSNLFLGDEIREVYSEIMKTVPTDHLNPEKDDLIEKCPEKIDLHGLMSSSTLYMKKATDRIINTKLKFREEAPWGEPYAKANWSKTPSSPPKDSKGTAHFSPLVPTQENIAFATNPQTGKLGGMVLADLPAMVAERMSRTYASWLAWWKGTINSDDYFKYLSTQENDYLGVIFHMYNSDAEEDEDDDPRSGPIEALMQQLEEARTRKLAELRSKKQEFSAGMWNAESVMLGGLGQDPDIEGDPEIVAIKRAIQKQINDEQAKKKRLGDVVKDRVKSANMTASVHGTVSPRSGRVSDSKAASSRHDTQDSAIMMADRFTAKKGSSPQERMEKIWSSLYLLDRSKLDMAIKYSSDAYLDTLDEAISAWEAATVLVLQREQLIGELEAFERLASDPNRFFERGYRGSSNARFDEARIRDSIYMKLDNMHDAVQDAVRYVQNTYGDIITYQGRPYLDKMKWDRTEMIYWLQEERKQQAIDMQSKISGKRLQTISANLIMPQS